MRLPTRLSHRKPDSHKGDFGHILILAGSARFSGAAVLCAEGAMRSGAGLITLGIPKSINNAIIKIKPKEAMTLPLPENSDGSLSADGYKKISSFAKDADIVVIGPGLGKNKSTQALVRKLAAGLNKPIVIDADGLNALAGYLKRGKNLIITPHPGEMARLEKTSIAKVQSDRKNIAKNFAKVYSCTVVLKGNRTVVASPSGEVFINRTGNPGMATAGSGDVLAGMIAAFWGQKLSPFEAAKYAVFLHGSAGDLAAREKTQISLIASDIIAKIPEAIKKRS